MRAILAGSLPWALGVLALCVTSRGRAQAPAPERQQGALEIEVHAPETCTGPVQFASLLRARLAGQVEPRASIVVTLTPDTAGVRAELQVLRAGHTTARRLEAATCAEAVNALSLVAALILDATPSGAPEAAPARRSTRAGARTAAPPSSAAPPPSRALEPSPAPASPAVATSASAIDERGPESEVEPPSAAPATAVAPAAEPSTRPREERPRARPPRQRGQLLLDLYASALLMVHSAPAIRPGASLGLALGVRRAALTVAGEIDARAALPHTERTSEGSARFALLAAGVRVCAEGLVAREHVGISGCASSELGALRGRGSDTDQPASSRSLWAAVGPGLRLAWYSAGRVGLRLGAELLLPLTRPRYTLGEDAIFSVGSVTYRLELTLRVRLL